MVWEFGMGRARRFQLLVLDFELAHPLLQVRHRVSRPSHLVIFPAQRSGNPPLQRADRRRAAGEREEVKFPEGKVLVPGVVGHATDVVEHPRVIADRLVRYAGLVGRENVMAGTDCGLGPRVGDPQIAWAKFEALAEGARLATLELWGK